MADLTAEQIAQMLEDKRCPECHQYVEYHRMENDTFVSYLCQQDTNQLIYHFNYDEIMREIR